jgi:hypothetical protein
MLISIIVMILISFTPLLRRAEQGMIKVVADQVGNQQEAEQLGGKKGYLINQLTLQKTLQLKRKREITGDTIYSYDGSQDSEAVAATTNLGYKAKTY